MKFLTLVQIACLTSGLAFGAAQAESNELFEALPPVFEASKYDQKQTKSPPASISVVTADEIKKYGYRNFGEIISSLKGFYNTNDRNYGYVGARGFGLPSDFNTRILLLIDGHRFNDNLYDSFDTSEGFPVDVDMIERVEVVRGPSSSMYGSNAFFGVINIITKRGRDQPGTNLKFSYGSNDTYKTSLSYGQRFSNGLEVFLTGTLYDSKGYPKLYYPEFDNPSQNHGIAENSDAERTKKLMAKIAYGDFTLQGLFSKRFKNVPTASYGTVFNYPNESTDDESTYIDAKYEHLSDNLLNFKARFSYNQYRYTGVYPSDYAAENEAPLVLDNLDVNRGQWWRGELEASKLFWDRHKISIGAEFQDNFDQFHTNYDDMGAYASHVNTYKWALYLQDEFYISDRLTLNTGLRYDYFSIFGDTLNPRAGLVYKLWESGTLKLLYGKAFRAPNLSELNFASVSEILSLRLMPEKLTTLELVFEQYLNSHLRVELSLFHNDIAGIIRSIAADNGAVQYQNTDEVESTGIEIQVEDHWSNGFQGRFSYSWQDTTNNADRKRLSNSPEHLLKLNLIAPLWQDKLFLGFETQFMSSRSTPRQEINGKVPAYVVNNLTLFSQNWLKGVELSGGVYNIFDQTYYDPGSSEHIQNAIQRDGLTFRVKLGINF